MPISLDLDMTKSLEELQKIINDYYRLSKLSFAEGVKELAGKEISAEEAQQIRILEFSLRFEKIVQFSHLPNKENRAKYEALFPLIPQDITSFMIIFDEQGFSGRDGFTPLSKEELTATLSLIPKHITKVRGSFNVDLRAYLPLHIDTLICYTFFEGSRGIDRMPSFPGMKCLEIRYDYNSRFWEGELEILLQPSLSELIIEPVALRSYHTKEYANSLSSDFWDVLQRADNIRSLHIGQWFFSFPNNPLGITALLSRVEKLPKHLKRLCIHWDDVRDYSLEDLKSLGAALMRRGIVDLELAHSGIAMSRSLIKEETHDVQNLDPQELSKEENSNKVKALIYWERKKNFIEDTLINRPHFFPQIAINHVEQYLGIPKIAPVAPILTIHSPVIKALFLAIEQLEDYGKSRFVSDMEKHDMAVRLADKLRKNTMVFICNNKNENTISERFNQLKQEFSDDIKKHEPLFSQHRDYNRVILANILIALTGIGALILGGKIAYSYFTTGKVEGFFNKTKGQEMVDEINEHLDHLILG